MSRLQALVDQGVVIYGRKNEIFGKIQSAMPLLIIGAAFMDAHSRTRNSDDSFTRYLSEPQTLLMFGVAAISLVMATLYSLFLPRDKGVQVDGNVDLDAPFKSSSSSRLFMQLVKSRDSLKYIHRITSEKINDSIEQVSPYFMLLFSSIAALSNTPEFIREMNNPEKRSICLASYLINASIIFSAAQSIRHPKQQEPRRKDCEMQVDEALLLQPRI